MDRICEEILLSSGLVEEACRRYGVRCAPGGTYLARRSPCDPRTLSRVARDHVATGPDFALEAGLLALECMVKGVGYGITGADARAAFDPTRQAAEAVGRTDELRERVQGLMAHPENGGWLEEVLGGLVG